MTGPTTGPTFSECPEITVTYEDRPEVEGHYTIDNSSYCGFGYPVYECTTCSPSPVYLFYGNLSNNVPSLDRIGWQLGPTACDQEAAIGKRQSTSDR